MKSTTSFLLLILTVLFTDSAHAESLPLRERELRNLVTSAPTSAATLETTTECISFCSQQPVTNVCGGAATGSYCALEDIDGNDIGTSCRARPRCTCVCPGGDIFYDVRTAGSPPADGSSTEDKNGGKRSPCGKNPFCVEEEFDFCFSPIATTNVYGKGRVMMKDLNAGDKVLTSDGKHQMMYSMNHYHTSKKTVFVQIKTDLELEQPLELTHNHLLYVADNINPVPASAVQVGDIVQTLEGGKEVLEINRITRDGFYNPLTMDGTIIVDGIIASAYTTMTGKSHVEIDGVWSTMMRSLSFHDALHMVSAPYRKLCTMVSLDLCNVHEEESVASAFMKSFFFSFWSNQNDCIKFIITLSYALVFGTLVNLTYFKVWCFLASVSAFLITPSKMTRFKKAATNKIST